MSISQGTDTAPVQGPGLMDAAKAFEGILDRAEQAGNPASSDEAVEAPADTASADEGVASAEAEAPETDAQADGAEAEAEGTEETPQEATAEDPLVTVLIDGKSEKVPLSEAVAGYQRTLDYQRKTTAVANQRRELEELRTAVAEERQNYAAMLVALRDQLQATQEEEPDWGEVYRADPVGYARRRDEWKDRQEKIAAAQYELRRVETLRQQEQKENLANIVRKGREQMLDMNPAWKDEAIWEADRTKLVEYAQKVAKYSREEISQAYDPRAIVTMHKARLWDELQASKPKPVVAQKVKVAPAGVAPASSTRTRLNAAQQRLARSGRIDDAAKVFEQRLTW